MLDKYRLFFEKRKSLNIDIAIAPYDWYCLPNPIDAVWFPYSQMLDEHARELSNSLNEFNWYIVKLKVWSQILDDLGEYNGKKHQIVLEFVSPIATLAINLPYVIRSRFFYSTAHLCHQANRLKISSWKDDLPIDTEIYQEHMERYGKPWGKIFCKLQLALQKVSNKAYQNDTLDFRNKYNHRYSPRIEIGITDLVTRNVDKEGYVSYGFGGTQPLKLKTIIPLLENQHSALMNVLVSYQELVNGQIQSIRNC